MESGVCSSCVLAFAAGAQETTLGFNGIITMQEMTAGVCHSAQYGEEGQLQDVRDKNIYWVTKLHDGNCWMTQNLDLSLLFPEYDSYLTLDPATSDVVTSYSFKEASSGLWNDTTSNTVRYYDPGTKYCNTSGCNLTASTNSGHDAVGNYYSWGAATAGQAANLTSSTTGQESTQSICPKGWRLPPNSGNGSYNNLLNGFSGTQITSVPFYFVYGGYVNNSSLIGAGSNGYYWSSTANSATTAYLLYFDSSSVYPSDYNFGRYLGYSVRCVAR